MIAELSVSQLAIIDKTTLALDPGFTVMTGETGAGKSLLVDAIQLALGERADTDLVRDQAKSAFVSVVFDLSLQPELQQRCAEVGVPLEEKLLYISREIHAEGRSQCRIGGRLFPVSVLRQITDLLVDLHGQHDHQALLRKERHLAYLDSWIGPEAQHLVAEVGALYAVCGEAQRKLHALLKNIRERDQRIDLLSHQIKEIEDLEPRIGEFEELQSQINRLQNLEKLTTALFTAHDNLASADGSATELIGEASRVIGEATKYDSSLQRSSDQLNDILFQLEDVSGVLAAMLSGIEGDAENLEESAARLDHLKKLRRKYGDDEEAVLRFAAEAKSELAVLEDAEASEERVRCVVEQSQADLIAASSRLSELRRSRAHQFSDLVEQEVRDLALGGARFSVGILPDEPKADGADDVEFVFSANPGEPLRPLHRVASGGELSRLMLALKTVLAGKAGVPTLIFDEIDVGLGGRVGATVGRKLAHLGEQYQVVVISHLAQVAALADAHFRIEKTESEGRTSTSVRKLDAQGRLHEIARMIGGEQLTDTALAHAREMLAASSSCQLEPAR